MRSWCVWALVGCALLLSSRTVWARPERAEVAVSADLTATSPVDFVTLRIPEATDRKQLSAIATALGTHFGTPPAGLSFNTGDPEFIADKGLGLECQLPVVPRQAAYLPIEPFIRAFAPYVSRLRILYIIKGPFTYRGFQQYHHRDVDISVEPPAPANALLPVGFYSVEVTIHNPHLAALNLPREVSPPARPFWQHPLLRLGVAALVGISIGLVLALWLARWRARTIG
jgi:hypothetical protein